jgi:branched-chain amino acid transport system substrate-binding protein
MDHAKEMPMKLTAKFAQVAAALGLTLLASAARADEFLVGSNLPLSGGQARWGQEVAEGLKLAAEAFNRANAKHKIKLAVVDDEGNAAKAGAAAEKLISDGAVALYGGFPTPAVVGAANAATKANLVYMSSGYGGTKAEFKNFFQINAISGYQRAIAGTILEMGVKSVALIHNTKEGSAYVANSVNAALTEKGVKVTMHPYDSAIADFKPLINKIKLQDRPEVIAMVGYENEYIGMLRAAKVLKPEVKAIVCAYGLATPKMLADFPAELQNVYGTSMLSYPAEFPTKEGKEFAEAFKKSFNKEPDYLAQFGYVSGQVLFEAIARAADAGTIAKGGVAAEMRKTDRQTLTGRVTFDETGFNPHFVLRMGQIQGDKIPLVWPKDAATAKMNFPAVPW